MTHLPRLAPHQDGVFGFLGFLPLTRAYGRDFGSCAADRPDTRGQRLGKGGRDVGLVAFQDLFAAEVAGVGEDLQLVRPEYPLRLFRHGRQLRSVMALVDHVVGDDQVVKKSDLIKKNGYINNI